MTLDSEKGEKLTQEEIDYLATGENLVEEQSKKTGGEAMKTVDNSEDNILPSEVIAYLESMENSLTNEQIRETLART